MQNSKDGRANLISVITSPLGFFALSLLIVEGFLTIALVGSDLDAGGKFIGMLIGAGLFLVVVFGVLFLVWHKPTNLTYGEKSHLEIEIQKFWGTSEKPKALAEIGGESVSNNQPRILSVSAPTMSDATSSGVIDE